MEGIKPTTPAIWLAINWSFDIVDTKNPKPSAPSIKKAETAINAKKEP